GTGALDAELLDLLADELNVGGVEELKAAGDSLVDTTAKANFRTLGKRFGKAVQQVAKAIAAADAAAISASLKESGEATVLVDGEPVTLGVDDVFVTETPQEGWAVAGDAGATVALDLHITPELRRAGIAREVIRQVQEARKSSGLEVTDRIALGYASADAETTAAVEEHAALIADEVLATALTAGEPGGAETHGDESLGFTFWLAKA
ncbi:MAG TPA: DUF5915 domain-containing protein, partial [Phytomonospora sp.]